MYVEESDEKNRFYKITTEKKNTEDRRGKRTNEVHKIF